MENSLGALQLNTSGTAGDGEQESLNGNNLDFGCTWLGRIEAMFWCKLLFTIICSWIDPTTTAKGSRSEPPIVWSIEMVPLLFG